MYDLQAPRQLEVGRLVLRFLVQKRSEWESASKMRTKQPTTTQPHEQIQSVTFIQDLTAV